MRDQNTRSSEVVADAATVSAQLRDLGGAGEANVWIRYSTTGNNGEDICDIDRVQTTDSYENLNDSDPDTTYRYRTFVQTDNTGIAVIERFATA